MFLPHVGGVGPADFGLGFRLLMPLFCTRKLVFAGEVTRKTGCFGRLYSCEKINSTTCLTGKEAAPNTLNLLFRA